MNKLLKSILISGAAGIGICGAVGNYFVNSYLSKKGIAKLQQGPGMLDEETQKILHSSDESLQSVEFYCEYSSFTLKVFSVIFTTLKTRLSEPVLKIFSTR